MGGGRNSGRKGFLLLQIDRNLLDGGDSRRGAGAAGAAEPRGGLGGRACEHLVVCPRHQRRRAPRDPLPPPRRTALGFRARGYGWCRHALSGTALWAGAAGSAGTDVSLTSSITRHLRRSSRRRIQRSRSHCSRSHCSRSHCSRSHRSRERLRPSAAQWEEKWEPLPLRRASAR